MSGIKKDSGLKSKDVITLGIFSLLYAVVLFAFAAAMGMFPITFIFYATLGAIPCGVIYMYVVTKIPKPGAIVIMTAVISGIYFLIGTYGAAPLYGVAGGVLAELVSYSGKYKSFWKNTTGYIIYTASLWFGFMSPMVLATDAYIKQALAGGYAQDYITGMVNFINGPLFFVALAGTAAGGLFGALFGRKMLKKHFEKAGII